MKLASLASDLKVAGMAYVRFNLYLLDISILCISCPHEHTVSRIDHLKFEYASSSPVIARCAFKREYFQDFDINLTALQQSLLSPKIIVSSVKS